MLRALIATGVAAGMCLGCSATDEVFQLETVRLNEEVPSVPALSSDAKQRFVFAPTVSVVEPASIDPNGDNIPVYTVNKRQIVCAEPSPDALTAIAAGLSASFEAQQGGEGGAGAEGQFTRTVSEAVRTIGDRTQTIQLIRDTLYRACEAYANGALDTFGYTLILGAYERFTMQSLGLDALSRRGPRASAAEAIVDAAARALETANAKVVQLELKVAEAEDPAVLQPELDAALKQREDALLKLEAANRTLEFARTNEEITGGSSADIVELAQTPTSENGGSTRVVSAACLMWFARNPNVRAVGGINSGGIVLPNDAPAIAHFCSDILKASLRANEKLVDAKLAAQQARVAASQALLDAERDRLRQADEFGVIK